MGPNIPKSIMSRQRKPRRFMVIPLGHKQKFFVASENDLPKNTRYVYAEIPRVNWTIQELQFSLHIPLSFVDELTGLSYI